MERTSWSLVLLVFLCGLLAAAQFGKIALTLPETAAAFGRPLPQVAPLVSLVGLMGLVLGAMAGGVAAGFGPGRTLLAGLLLGGAMSLIQAALPGYWWFVASRAVEGLAHLALVVAGPPLMAAAASERDRPLVMGLWAVFFGASLAVSAAIFPPILAAGGLPLLFALHGAALLALAVPLWRLVPRIPRTPISLNPLSTHRAIYARMRTVAPALGFWPYTFLFVALVALLPPGLDRPRLAASLPIVTLLTTLLGGALCRRFAPWQVTAAGFAGTALGLAGAAVALPGALPLAFAAMGLIPGASFAAIPALNAAPADRARATGAIAQLGNLGTVSGTPILAAIWAGFGIEAVIWSGVGVAALGLALGVWSGRQAAGTTDGDVLGVH
ncbi:MFS transporter [Jannaschia formosa]|uniref:MFS transporter n=1 Tax=Jannaschia formosa TaxID=2259592 RepID=UPI000E1C3B7E|nr:MFS transporter [Jannaschia formosa]TFL17428.1 MFS transporter [Jannaschia formosa]